MGILNQRAAEWLAQAQRRDAAATAERQARAGAEEARQAALRDTVSEARHAAARRQSEEGLASLVQSCGVMALMREMRQEWRIGKITTDVHRESNATVHIISLGHVFPDASFHTIDDEYGNTTRVFDGKTEGFVQVHVRFLLTDRGQLTIKISEAMSGHHGPSMPNAPAGQVRDPYRASAPFKPAEVRDFLAAELAYVLMIQRTHGWMPLVVQRASKDVLREWRWRR